MSTHLPFHQWLKKRRKALDLTHPELSARAGCSVNTLRKLESGERRPSRELAARLASGLQISAEEHAAFLAYARVGVTDELLGAEPPAMALLRSPAVQEQASPPLLLTKILTPPPRPQLISRPRLTDRLDQLSPGGVALLVAAAGSGKTTLLSEWVVALPPARASRVAWLTLEIGDGDPLHLLRYVIAALARVDHTLGADALALLDAPQAAAQTVLTLLLNGLAQLHEPATLILDDYHLIQAPVAHQALDFLVAHLPPTLRLIIATREDPPLPLSRLRARGQLLELRGHDLRFRAAEAEALLNDAFGLSLAGADVAALVERTEGWGAGLQIAGLALRGHADPRAFIDSFSGSQRLVLDYLADEVLARLPAHMVRFLLSTSILDALSGPLCDAALDLGDTGNESYSRLMLDELVRRNLFLVPLDDQAGCYRYHHLFGALLRERLRRGASPEQVAAIHGRVADWYAGRGMPVEAARHAIAGGQPELAAQALAAYGEQSFHAAADTLVELIRALPEALCDAHPQLWYLLGIHARYRWDYRAVKQHLQRAHDGFARQGDEAARGRCLVLLTDAYRIAGDQRLAQAAVAEALTTPLPPGYRTVALMAHAFQQLALGDLAQTNAAVDEALGLLEAGDEPPLLYDLAVAFRTPLVMLPGGPGRAARFSQILRRRPPGPADPLHAQAYMLDGLVQLIHGEPAAAAAALAQALALDAQFGRLPWLSIDTQVWWVNCAILQGNLDGAAERYNTLWATLQAPSFAGFRRVWGAAVMALLARICWLQGDAAALRAIAAQLPPTPLPGEWPTSALARRLISALLALMERQEDDGERALLELLPLQAQRPDAALLGDARLILGHLYLGQGRTREALAQLSTALSAHAEAGTPGLAMLTGEPVVVPLLRLALAHRLHPALAGRMLQALGAPADAVPKPALPAARITPDALTPRELEVLRLIAAGASNHAIAEHLVLSVATVKKHINNLFAKLGAQSRTQALVHARERHLL